MKIEILNTFIHDGQRFETGEVRNVPDELGGYFCRAGWVKDLSGATPTAAPDKNDVVLMVDSAVHKTNSENIDG